MKKKVMARSSRRSPLHVPSKASGGKQAVYKPPTKAECVRAIQSWCQRRGWKLLSRPRHVYPRAYVIGYVAQSCLIVAKPWMDAEPQLLGTLGKFWSPMDHIREFDESLKSGDWCITAYISREGCGESIAIPHNKTALEGIR